MDVFQQLRKRILFSRALKRDPIFQSVMKMVRTDENEALDHEIEENDYRRMKMKRKLRIYGI